MTAGSGEGTAGSCSDWLCFDLGYEIRRATSNPAQAFQSAAARVGPGVPGSHAAPVAGKSREASNSFCWLFDPGCYLCPGNSRAGGAQTPQYAGTYVFDNDYPALLPGGEAPQFDKAGLLAAQAEPGICRVMCFSPRHDLTVARMSQQELRSVVDGWAEQYSSLGEIPWIRHMQIFENRGELMGASNPHPHCQIW